MSGGPKIRMIAHLRDRADALVRSGWTRREAEWLALVCLHSGVFLRSQYLAFIGRTNPALANRFVRRCRKHAVEQPWNGSRLRICRIAARRIYRAIGAEHIRHRRPAAPEVVLRRLLSLDYVLEHPHAAWLPTEDEKVTALTAAGIAREVLPRRLYQGAVGAQYRYFPPQAARGARPRAGDVPVRAGRGRDRERGPHGGGQHAALWAALAAAGRAVEVVVVGRDPVRLAAAGRVLDKWAATPPESVMMPCQEAAAELAAIKKAIATSDWDALEVYGGLNPAIQRACVLGAAYAGSRKSRAAVTTGRTWRSKRVPEWIPAGRSAGEAA